MTCYEVGQVLRWGLSITDDDGNPADTGTMPQATVALPGGTTAPAGVTRLGVGDYVAELLASATGRYRATWTATGVNSGGLPLTDTSIFVGGAALGLITVGELALRLQTEVPSDRAAAAQAACEDAAAGVAGYLQSDLTDLLGWQLVAAKLVALSIAVRVFTNGLERSTYSGPENLAYTGPVGCYPIGKERDQLDALTAPGIA